MKSEKQAPAEADRKALPRANLQLLIDHSQQAASDKSSALATEKTLTTAIPAAGNWNTASVNYFLAHLPPFQTGRCRGLPFSLPSRTAMAQA